MMKETQHALLCRGAVVAWVARVGGARVQVRWYTCTYQLPTIRSHTSRYVYGTRVLEYYNGTKYCQPTSRSSHSTTYYEPQQLMQKLKLKLTFEKKSVL